MAKKKSEKSEKSEDEIKAIEKEREGYLKSFSKYK